MIECSLGVTGIQHPLEHRDGATGVCSRAVPARCVPSPGPTPSLPGTGTSLMLAWEGQLPCNSSGSGSQRSASREASQQRPSGERAVTPLGARPPGKPLFLGLAFLIHKTIGFLCHPLGPGDERDLHKANWSCPAHSGGSAEVAMGQAQGRGGLLT